jgi:hypothetical protein
MYSDFEESGSLVTQAPSERVGLDLGVPERATGGVCNRPTAGLEGRTQSRLG